MTSWQIVYRIQGIERGFRDGQEDCALGVVLPVLVFLNLKCFHCHKSPAGNMVKGYSCTIVFDVYMIYRWCSCGTRVVLSRCQEMGTYDTKCIPLWILAGGSWLHW